MDFVDGRPITLYKYRGFSQDFDKSFLFKQELFWTPPELFNDPYDCAIPFRYDPVELGQPDLVFQKLYSLAKQQHPDWDEGAIHQYCYRAQKDENFFDEEHFRQISDKVKKVNKEKYGVISLTIKPLNYLMWSHYAEKHTGYCIGFHTPSLQQNIGGALSQVDYLDAIPYFKLFEDMPVFFRRMFCTKGKFWEYEDEYRFVSPESARKIVHYNLDIVKEIYLGFEMTHPNKMEIIDFIKCSGVTDISIFQIELSKDFFTIEANLVYQN